MPPTEALAPSAPSDLPARIAAAQHEIASSALDLHEIMHLVVERARQLTGADSVSVEIIAVGESPGQPAREASAHAGARGPIAEVRSAPIRRGPDPLGVLIAASSRPGRFSDREERTLEQLAAFAGPAISHAVDY